VNARADMPSQSASSLPEPFGSDRQTSAGEPDTLIRTMDGHVTFWSSGMEKRYGFASADALGRDTRQLLKTIFFQAPHEIDDMLVARSTWSGGLIHHHAEGPAILSLNHWRVHSHNAGQDSSITETHCDFTLAKTGGRHLLADMITTITRELSEPLTAINAYLGGALSMLERGWPDRGVLTEALTSGTAQIARSAEVVRLLRVLENALRHTA
jgi:hypothetical protein